MTPQKRYSVTTVEEIIRVFEVSAGNELDAEHEALSGEYNPVRSDSQGFTLVEVEQIEGE